MKKILIVEDEHIFAQDIKMIMESEGYNVLSIVDSDVNALDMVETYRPDMILIDIKLRGKMDGIEIIEEIQKNHRMPIIYLTAFTEKKTVDRAMKTNPIAYLVKPIIDNELINIVKEILN